MKIRSATGDDAMNELAMAAMFATINRLADNGVISAAAATQFLDDHVCMMAPSDGPFARWLKRVTGRAPEAGHDLIVIAKLTADKS